MGEQISCWQNTIVHQQKGATFLKHFFYPDLRSSLESTEALFSQNQIQHAEICIEPSRP
jgi:hypothetical protein